MAKSRKKEPPIDFEAAMTELESLVDKMEQGEFSLEESIKQFERGMALVRSCQKSLRAAEQKVLKLAGENKDDDGPEALEDLELPDAKS